jgi:hypothetical protein
LIDLKREVFGNKSSRVLSVIIYDIKYIINRMTVWHDSSWRHFKTLLLPELAPLVSPPQLKVKILTLCFLRILAIINAPHMRSVRYDVARDFDAVGRISLFPRVLVVAANSKYQSIKEILADASAWPGEVVCANGGTGTTSYLACETLMHLSGVKLLQVPYKGEGAPAPDILPTKVPQTIDL